MDPYSAVGRSTSNAMRRLEHNDCCDLSSLLESLPRLRRDVLLEPHRVPNLDSSVFRTSREEELIGSDDDVGDRSRVFDEVSDESSFRSRRCSFTWRERSAKSSATWNTGSDVRSKFGERFSVRIKVSSFEKLLDAWIVTLCFGEKVRSFRANGAREIYVPYVLTNRCGGTTLRPALFPRGPVPAVE